MPSGGLVWRLLLFGGLGGGGSFVGFLGIDELLVEGFPVVAVGGEVVFNLGFVGFEDAAHFVGVFDIETFFRGPA